MCSPSQQLLRTEPCARSSARSRLPRPERLTPEPLRASATLLLAATGGVEPAPKPKPAELEAAITRAYACVLELGVAYDNLAVAVEKRVKLAPAPLKVLMAAVEAPPRVMGLAH